ncbi:hypothetical protein M1116_01975 [Patescibacteria group bacterium]|nr:hypothetical protein [Patescibacteria group bacterium]
MYTYEEIARNESVKYCNYPDLVGILWIGSSSFGIKDGFTDIDIRILVDKDHKSQPMKQYKVSNLKIEVDEMMSDWLFNNLTLDSEQAWIIEKAIIIYDPKNECRKLLEKARNNLEGIDKTGLLWNNYSKLYLHYDLEKCLKRKQIIGGHIVLSNILDSLSKFIYLYQNKTIPPQKWRWYMIEKEKLFDVEKINELALLNLKTSSDEIITLLLEIQNDCQKIMLDLGFDKEKVMEPWRF